MDRAFFAEQLSAVRRAYAAGLGCDEAAFSSETLTIVDRPPHVTWVTANAATFGNGTVVSMDPEYRSFVEEHAPPKHYRALSAGLMGALVQEGARRGTPLAYYTPGVGFALGERPRHMATPEGLALRLMDQAWMAAQQQSGRFDNGVGQPNMDARDIRNQFAVALFDGQKPAAVAGAFDTYGLFEIGVDVEREYRGRGIATFIVNAVVREILERGKTPFYACAATNVRSHRTAEACGFSVVCSDACVSPTGEA